MTMNYEIELIFSGKTHKIFRIFHLAEVRGGESSICIVFGMMMRKKNFKFTLTCTF